MIVDSTMPPDLSINCVHLLQNVMLSLIGLRQIYWTLRKNLFSW
jgi:hypothetical protein